MAESTSTPRQVRPEKRELILTAAKARFYRYGIQKTTMQEIARDAGLAVGTLYLYFRNKDEIIVAAAEAFAHRHREEIRDVLASGLEAEEKLRRYILGRYEASRQTRMENTHHGEIARAVVRLKPDRLDEESRWMYDTVLLILKDGIRSGVFQMPDVERDAEVFLFSIAFFFPVVDTELRKEPEVTGLLKVMDWFIEKWRSTPRA